MASAPNGVRRDMRRNKLQMLLNKDSHGLTVKNARAKNDADSTPEDDFSPQLTQTHSPVPIDISTSLHRHKESLDELRHKYRSMRKNSVHRGISNGGNTGRTETNTPLRVQRQRMLLPRSMMSHSRDSTDAHEDSTNISTAAADDDISTPTHCVDVDEDEDVDDEYGLSATSLKSQKNSGYLLRPFAKPLRRWKDHRRKHDEMEEQKAESDVDSHRMQRRARALISHIKKLPKKRRQEDLHIVDDDEGFGVHDDDDDGVAEHDVEHEHIDSDNLSDAADMSTDIRASMNINRDFRTSLTPPSTPIDEPLLSNTMSSQMFHDEHTSSSSVPSMLAIHTTHGVNAARIHDVTSNVCSPTEFRCLLRRVEELTDNVERLNSDVRKRFEAVARVGRSEDYIKFEATLRRLEQDVRLMDARHIAAISEQERRIESRLEKITESFKKNLDAVANRVGEYSSRPQTANCSLSEYLLTYFVVGLSTLLLPFAYIYHICSRFCHRTKRRRRARIGQRTQSPSSTSKSSHFPIRRLADNRERAQLSRRSSHTTL